MKLLNVVFDIKGSEVKLTYDEALALYREFQILFSGTAPVGTGPIKRNTLNAAEIDDLMKKHSDLMKKHSDLMKKHSDLKTKPYQPINNPPWDLKPYKPLNIPDTPFPWTTYGSTPNVST